MKKVLFLCHGNICRSVMAEYIMKDLIIRNHLENEYYCESKALSNEEIGNDIYYLAKECLDRHNISYQKHRARKFEISDLNNFDSIYIMDKSNEYIISSLVGTNSKIHYLNGQIEDPWYTGNFDKVYNQINEGVFNILKEDI